MATNYNQSTIAGSSWQRAKQVVIDNMYNAVPVIEFKEEILYEMGNTVMTQAAGSLFDSYNPATVINVLDPSTGLTTGISITMAQFYQYLYSYYLQIASQRDANIAANQAAMAAAA